VNAKAAIKTERSFMVEVGLITVIRRTGEDRFGAVELFKGDEQRKFVLEGLRAE
jgi:hypothetical protein